ncbi:MAG TPA: hypothetical protein VMW29_02935 [Candidatus Bathyarchaeia archaeon]|nr:hypothetical protein [Candidatus Bathyarchaeia archaeon]
MQNIELVSFGIIIIFASVLAYKSSLLQNKKIGYISLLQIFYLILVPGVTYTILFSYLLEILERPQNTYSFLNNKILVNILLLSILYTYGGLAIHGVCKTVASYFSAVQKKSLAYKVNNHFHRQLSHNLTFIGAFISATCFAILELNHQSPYPEKTKLTITILNGIFIGVASILGLSFYKKRWLELKVFFFSVWMLFIILGYAVKPYIKNVKSYPFTLMILIAFSILTSLNIFLYIKKVKNKIRLGWRVPRDLLE